MCAHHKDLLCYNLCWPILTSRFPPEFCPIPALYVKFPGFYAKNISPVFYCDCNVHDRAPLDCLWSVANDSVRLMRGQGEGGGGVIQVQIVYVCVRTKILWHKIYCSNPRLDPGS